MASISRDKNGRKRIQWTDEQGKRHTIRLGKINMKAADAFLARLERLIASHITNTSVDVQTAQWLRELPDSIHSKLAKQGLVEAREPTEQHTLDSLLNAYFETATVKQSTLTRYFQTRRLLIERFGAERPLENISHRDADEWKSWLLERGYAPAKVARDIGIARMFFRTAVRWDLIATNPFEGVRAGSQTNREKLTYITPEDTLKLIEDAPDADWRCIIALARYGGLRCPSEVLSVRWEDIDWDRTRLRVRSPKTEHHAGKGERVIPLFPELRQVLMDAFEQAPEGAERVVHGYPPTTTNLRTHMQRIIRRAGLTPWPRLFNALRASRATELAAEYPAAICTSWLGHTQAIAEAHYHMVRDEDFERAAASPIGTQSGAKSVSLVSQNASQQQAAPTGNEIQAGSQTKKDQAFMPVLADDCSSLQSLEVGVTGLEPVTSAM